MLGLFIYHVPPTSFCWATNPCAELLGYMMWSSATGTSCEVHDKSLNQFSDGMNLNLFYVQNQLGQTWLGWTEEG